ncbi:fungal-specific transcription factor domain-containing protein [Thelonectria olida]|uniref:Fungal-specific transcription factor domain-containing protein n=1 Tax=Thelonectria olida TaxID=1576542 RepID=A0A9P8W503_9HYPO|nr:fungal-specific transcription factor domain-containing protein [Thelonectria olida]
MASVRSPTLGSSPAKSQPLGCWTCRAKHVQCDKTKPLCLQCQKSGSSCSGYSTRLSWTLCQEPSGFRLKTQNDIDEEVGNPPDASVSSSDAILVEQTAPDSTESETDRQKDHADVQCEPEAETEPLHAQRPHGELGSDRGNSPRASDQDVAISTPTWTWSEQPQECATGDGFLSLFQETLDARVYSPPSPLDGVGYSDVMWLPPHQAPTPICQDIDWSDTFTPCQSSRRHLDTLSDPGLQCQLIEHWNLHLCDALGPIPGMHNPLRTVLIPLALEGVQADSASSTGATALFHLICSASAFHLAKIETAAESKGAFEALGLEHHNVGIAHLSKNIQSNDESQCVSILASILMCLFNEAIIVPTPFWRLHIQGAVEWVNHIENHVWHRTEAASIIYQLFMATAILLQSQLLPDSQSMWDVRYDPIFQPQPYILEGTYGLPQPLLQRIYSMNCLQVENHLPWDGEHLKAQSLDRLELELLLSAPKRRAFTRDQQHEDLVYHHAYTYYYAAIIYLKRTLKGVPLEEVQTLVEESLPYMEALETITDRPFSPLLWPIAFIAFETHRPALQSRMLACLDVFAKRSGLLIWKKFSLLVRELWSNRKLGGDVNERWHACLPFSSKDVMMLW